MIRLLQKIWIVNFLNLHICRPYSIALKKISKLLKLRGTTLASYHRELTDKVREGENNRRSRQKGKINQYVQSPWWENIYMQKQW